MIGSTLELLSVLHQFGSFLDMLEALRLQVEETQNIALFEHLAKGPIAILTERTEDIRVCLQDPPPFLIGVPKLHTDLRFFVCLAETLLATHQWSMERGQFALFSQSAAGLVVNLRAVAVEMQNIPAQKEAA